MRRAKSVDDVVALIRSCIDMKSFMSFTVGKCKLTIGSTFGHKELISLHGVWLDSRDRGKGEATSALALLVMACDSLHISVLLEVQPMNKQTNSESLVRLYTKHGFKHSAKYSDTKHFMMLRKPSTKKATAMKHHHVSLKQASRHLTTAGVKHRIVIANGLSKFSDSSKQFAASVVTALKAAESDVGSNAVVKAHVMKILIKLLPAFNGKKFSKLQSDKIQEAVKKSDVYTSCSVYTRKSTSSTQLDFMIYYGKNERSEFSVYLRTDEDGKFDAHKTLQDNKTHFDNVIQTAEKAGGIDEAKLLPLLVKFRELGEEIADLSGTYVTSFSGLIDFVSRH